MKRPVGRHALNAILNDNSAKTGRQIPADLSSSRRLSTHCHTRADSFRGCGALYETMLAQTVTWMIGSEGTLAKADVRCQGGSQERQERRNDRNEACKLRSDGLSDSRLQTSRLMPCVSRTEESSTATFDRQRSSDEA